MATILEFTALTGQELTQALGHLKGWEKCENKLVKTFAYDSFFEAIAFVNRMAVVAEQLNHHPNIEVHFKQVTVQLWTHKTQSITQADVVLAGMIEQVSLQLPA